MSPLQTESTATAAALSLLSAEAVRTRAWRMLALGLNNRLLHFSVDLDRLNTAVDLVLAVTRGAYPSLDVPFHSRWRHFVVDGEDRWASLNAATKWPDRATRARSAFDLAAVSVLLDAGAGPDWAYTDPRTGRRVGRSEGLALASFNMFARGAFSARRGDPLRVDAEVMARLPNDVLRHGFQVADSNPLVGLEGRAELLRRLGAVAAASPNIFGVADAPRPGGLFDHLAGQTHNDRIGAPSLLSSVLYSLGPVWPSRLTLAGIALGDCWHHPTLAMTDATTPSPASGLARAAPLRTPNLTGPYPSAPLFSSNGTGETQREKQAAVDPTCGLVPLHKLSQWLTYSLIEPMQAACISVVDINGLTGLAEYRNGGLFIDTGVLMLRHREEATRVHFVSSALVVEWRALTVALVDLLSERLRERTGLDAISLPLAKVLEGGTWAAGRNAAYARRACGSPPLRVVSDGTVF
jgi:Protein of unknown function (DUF1688)